MSLKWQKIGRSNEHRKKSRNPASSLRENHFEKRRQYNTFEIKLHVKILRTKSMERELPINSKTVHITGTYYKDGTTAIQHK